MMEAIGIDVSLFDQLENLANEEERHNGLDIADYLMRMESNQAVLQSMIKRYPQLQTFIDTFDLELVSVSRIDEDSTERGGQQR